MINKLTLQNFQSHKKTEIEFSKGLNIIVGQTDSGKSSIFKAIIQLFQNKPTQNRYKSNWGGASIIKAKINDDTIIRNDGKKRFYKLNEKVFKAFGTKVPEEIEKVVNFEDVNIQKQLDSHFLLSNSSGEAAQFFNKIANLESIDTSQKNIKKWIGELNKEIKIKAVDLEEEIEELEKYKNIDKIEAHVENAENLQKTIQFKNQKINKIESILKRVDAINNELGEHELLLSHEKTINSIHSLIKQKKEKETKIEELEFILSQIKKINSQIEENNTLLNYEKTINNVLDLTKQKETQEEQLKQIENLINKVNNKNKLIKEEESHYNAIHKRFDKYMGDKCILCGTKL